MVVLIRHAVEPGLRAVADQLPNPSHANQELQVAIDRTQAYFGEPLSHHLEELERSGMRFELLSSSKITWRCLVFLWNLNVSMIIT